MDTTTYDLCFFFTACYFMIVLFVSKSRCMYLVSSKICNVAVLCKYLLLVLSPANRKICYLIAS